MQGLPSNYESYNIPKVTYKKIIHNHLGNSLISNERICLYYQNGTTKSILA